MTKKAARRQAVLRLLDEGLFLSREEALPFFLSGQVFCGTQRVTSPAQLVPDDSSLTVRGRELPYVAKGGLKLEGALRGFGIQAGSRVCIDAGACTGGFTDCLLKHGASLVYAVEVGFGQLAGSLRQNPKVVNLEKTNIGDESLMGLDPTPTLASVDLSYLSLEKAVPIFAKIMDGCGELVCLVKPLFEVADSEARRTGIIAPEAYLPTLISLAKSLNAQASTRVIGVTNSPVTGNNGTHEFFFHVALGVDVPVPDLRNAMEESIARVLSLDAYKKG